MTHHDTLETAIADALAYDTYAYPTITRVGDGYTVEPGLAIETPNGDIDVMWTYDGGAEVGDQATDYTRVLDPCESLTELKHLEYNMPAAVEAIESGHAVTLMWCVVDAYPESDSGVQCEDCGWCENCTADMSVGHMWLAYWDENAD